MFSACETYEKQLSIEKTRLSHHVWSHGGSTFKKKRTLNGHFSRPAETDPYGNNTFQKEASLNVVCVSEQKAIFYLEKKCPDEPICPEKHNINQKAMKNHTKPSKNNEQP